MSRAIVVTVPVAGPAAVEYLNACSFAQQFCASAQQVVAFPGISVAAGVPRHYHRLADSAVVYKSRGGDAGLCRVCKVTDLVKRRQIVVRCCKGSEESSNPNMPEEHASHGGGEEEKEGGGNGNATDERGAEASVWDLQVRHKQLQAVAAKMGDPFRDIMSTAGKKLQLYLDSYKNSKAKDKHLEPKKEWDWERWQAYIHEIQEQQNLASSLKFQLEDAVASENFSEAAKLKTAVAAITSNDIIAEVMQELKKALEEERYHEAAKIRDKGGAGLVGWWVARAESADDPYGRIVHISSDQGRYIARGYSARQLSTAAPGIPLFEVFLRKDGDEGYLQQAVYLQRDGRGDSTGGDSKTTDINVVHMNITVEDGKDAASKTVSEASENDKDKLGDSDLTDEGLNRIMNFLKDRIPDVKLKIFRVISPNGEDDIPKFIDQLMEEVARLESENDNSAKDDSNNDLNLEITLSAEGKDLVKDEQVESPMRLVVGGAMQGAAEDRIPRIPIRVPARIEYKTRDSFWFHISETSMQQQLAAPKEPLPSWKVAAISTQAYEDLMPPDLAKVFWNVETVPVKVSKEVGEFLKLAVSQVQKKRGLHKCTSFQRIKASRANNDPLCGLYIGAFGPYTSELVQLRRKYGHWHEDVESSHKNSLEFFEYVEAVKLTGDMNVPAGQVTFRAKIGRG
eukprot:c28738_g1_i2 orf=628-2670(+)